MKYKRKLKPCIVCGRKTRDRIFVYNYGSPSPPICSDVCFNKACSLFKSATIPNALIITEEDTK